LDNWQPTLLAGAPELARYAHHMRERFGITAEEGQAVLQRVLAIRLPQIVVATQDLQELTRQWERLALEDLLGQSSGAALDQPLYARPSLRTPYVAPRSEAERRLAAIWQDALGIEQVGVNDHFFDLGGNSLTGLKIVARVQKEFGIPLAAASLYEAPTVATLAALISPPPPVPAADTASQRGKDRKERMRRQAQQASAARAREQDHE
jgi:acyl carrier protein